MERITISRAAQIVNCHPETIRRLDRRGIIKVKRDYRGHRIFTRNELLKLKKERERLR
jgi:DNA-binding transcriptional MerR regulator